MTHQQQQIVQRVFGADATLNGDMGVRGVTGELRLTIRGEIIARAETMQDLLATAQKRLRHATQDAR